MPLRTWAPHAEREQLQGQKQPSQPVPMVDWAMVRLQYVKHLETSINMCIHTLHYITLRYATLRYITLRYVTLHYITVHYITLHVCIYIYTYLYIKIY